MRTETIYTPQGDEYGTVPGDRLYLIETIYTPQGDEYNSGAASTCATW